MNGHAGPILVLESDRGRAEGLAQQLAADGYRVDVARSAEHARILAAESPPRLALLGELGGPGGAVDLLAEIRRAPDGDVARWDRHVPVVVRGPGTNQIDALRAFEAGADDYLPLARGYLELRARVRAVLRRAETPRELDRRLQVGTLAIDVSSRAARVAGEEIDLRRLEFDLLVHLAREPARVFHRGELLRAVWGYRCSGSTRTVDSHASRLRRKLDRHGSRAWVIGVRGIGYRLM